MSPGDDWSSPMVGKDWEGDYEDEKANAMYQFPGWIYFAMVMGYYFAFGAFIYMWLNYCKWKWENVPEYMQYHSRLARRKKNVRRRNKEDSEGRSKR